MLVPQQTAAHAAWDLQPAGAVEELLRAYIQTLPNGARITPPRLFNYQGKVFSRPCPSQGIDSLTGYSADHKLYLDASLGDQVASTYGDFGALSIIAHEFGHAYLSKHVKYPEGKAGGLAADRLAGGFTRYLNPKCLLEPLDIVEARATFSIVGDHEVYHYGTTAERRAAFEDGYQQGLRLPGDEGADQPQAPALPLAEQPTLPAPATQPAQALSVLGLGLAALVAVVILSCVITLVNRARDDEI